MIKVGDLTTNFFKSEQIDYGGMPLPSNGTNPFEHTYAVLADLSERLNNLENSIQFKVDSGDVISQILLTEDAALISADRIAVVGQVTFADFVRDQNGQSTGEVDPKITQIIGDKIRTGEIWSNAYVDSGGTTGMVMDLDNSRFHLGGESAPTLKFSANQLDIAGIVNILDRGSELGYLATGTAAYVTGVGPSGSGIIVGSPGIMGVYNGDIKLGFEAATGNASFAGTIAVGSTIDGSVLIGTKTATEIDNDTAEALATANAVDADLNSPSYLSTLLSDSAIAIDANSTSFLKLQSSDTTGVFIGSGGIYGKSSGSTTFSISSLTGDALFSGTISTDYQVKVVTASDALSTGYAGYFNNNSSVTGKKKGVYASGDEIGLYAYSAALNGKAVQAVASDGVAVDATGGSGGVAGVCTATGGAGVYGGTTLSASVGVQAVNSGGGNALYVSGISYLGGNTTITGTLDATNFDDVNPSTNGTKTLGATGARWASMYANRLYKGTGVYEAVGTMKVWQIASGTDGDGDWGTYRYTFY
jgi:hypothetical protein